MQTETLTKCDICNSSKIVVLDKQNNICQCTNCQYIFDSPRPTMEEIIKYYSKPQKYNQWINDENEREQLWNRRLKKLLQTLKTHNINNAQTLLDVGTGIGQFLNLAKPYFKLVTGTEVSDSAIKIAQEKYGLTLYKGVLDEINFNQQKFDVITLFHVLEHVPSPTNTIKKCTSLLNKGGIVVVAVPNDVISLKVKIKHLLKLFKIGKFAKAPKMFLPKIVLDGSIDEIHLSHFTKTTLTTLFEKQGLKVLQCGPDPYYVAKGTNLTKHNLYYNLMNILNKITRQNWYDTTWIVGQKS